MSNFENYLIDIGNFIQSRRNFAVEAGQGPVVKQELNDLEQLHKSSKKEEIKKNRPVKEIQKEYEAAFRKTIQTKLSERLQYIEKHDSSDIFDFVTLIAYMIKDQPYAVDWEQFDYLFGYEHNNLTKDLIAQYKNITPENIKEIIKYINDLHIEIDSGKQGIFSGKWHQLDKFEDADHAIKFFTSQQLKQPVIVSLREDTKDNEYYPQLLFYHTDATKYKFLFRLVPDLDLIEQKLVPAGDKQPTFQNELITQIDIEELIKNGQFDLNYPVIYYNLTREQASETWKLVMKDFDPAQHLAEKSEQVTPKEQEVEDSNEESEIYLIEQEENKKEQDKPKAQENKEEKSDNEINAIEDDMDLGDLDAKEQELNKSQFGSPITLKIKRLVQDPNTPGCLLVSTQIINDYLEQHHIPKSHQLANQGNPKLAHSTIDRYGHQEATGEHTSQGQPITEIVFDTYRARAAFDYIQYCLEHDLPVLVGLNYRKDTYHNWDGVTDHFAVIYGRDTDSNGFYFKLYDVAGGYDRKLYIDFDYSIRTAKTDKGKPYQLTQVRLYPKHREHKFLDITGMLPDNLNQVK